MRRTNFGRAIPALAGSATIYNMWDILWDNLSKDTGKLFFVNCLHELAGGEGGIRRR